MKFGREDIQLVKELFKPSLFLATFGFAWFFPTEKTFDGVEEIMNKGYGI